MKLFERLIRWGALALAGGAAGCLPPQTGYDAQRDNPLGPSFWIVPTPSDDDGLLGRIFTRPPDASLTLEEQSAPNPCAGALSPKRESQMRNHYENAIATQDSASGGAVLANYGFAAGASGATHLLYKVTTSSKVTQLDTTEYQSCCRQQDCGWGYVQSLVRGDGEYAAGAEVSSSAHGNYTVVSGRAERSFQISERKAIRGFLAAVIVAHDRQRAVKACSPGYEWAVIECVPKGQMFEAEQLCRYGKPQAREPLWAGNESMLALFRRDQERACEWLAAHGGPQLTPPPLPAPRPVTPPQPGRYVGTEPFWSGELRLNGDGTVERDDGREGIWLFDGEKLVLRWQSGLPDELRETAPDTYETLGGRLKVRREPR